ncbi:hypothetical protein G6F46_005631 [Rhizopus delemar]|uniref:MIF4G domain-containing protein n=2 Tax=Rhizopus TaxID=4842 RepID=A0A9P6ZEF9_9FUNG|nr:hypothetical protein G6F55_004156 [Rhizopus delemar]KAG1545601.1 hypothetical protein G6F51_005367 [Rhizopus arrhizus]KAG1512474.1 hypothetical protein G6F53_005162 [Rhizopus delemar]KAG1576557.1 hypothetical protein G6F50_000110 [Rhizopus delemar]KAG1616190.1 hypothetical protein G6F46_005631 [Rhizopus delemar]
MQPTYIPPQTRESSNSRNNSASSYPSSQYYGSNNYGAANFNGQTFVRPPTGSKAIPIINPNNREVVQLPAATKESDSLSSQQLEVSKENADARPIKIVDPKEKEHDLEGKENKEAETEDIKEDENKDESLEAETKKEDVIEIESNKEKVNEPKEEKTENSIVDEEEKKEVEEMTDESEGKKIDDKEVVLTEESKTEESKTEESKTEESKTEESKAEKSKSEEPVDLKESNDKKEEEPEKQAEELKEEKPVIPAPTRCKGDRVIYEIAFMMQFKDCKELPTGANLTPFEDMSTERPNDRGGRSMSRRQTSERGRGPRGLAGEAMLRSGSGRGPRRQDSSGPGSPGGMERQGSNRNRSSRGGKSRRQPKEKDESGKDSAPSTPLEEVVPLVKSQNRWVPKVQSTETAPPKEGEEEELISQEMIMRKVKSLLNKLTLEKFESISNQIWDYAKQAEKEEDSLSLKTVIDLIFDKACDEPAFAVMWAQLAKKLYELTATNENIKNVNIIDEKTNKPSCGGPLYRKYLLNRCQADFHKGWKNDIPQIDENAADVMLTDEYYAAVKAKRRGLGLVQFIGELYKLRILSGNVMKECLRRLCSDTKTPGDEETETMCKLLTTVGQTFESSDINNKQWLDVYFARMKEMYESTTLSSRVKFMILDVMDLRKSRWTLKRGNAQAGPKTIAQIHEEAKKASEEKEKETMKRSGSSRSIGTPISRQGSARSIANLSR